jgi:hypothetical protein
MRSLFALSLGGLDFRDMSFVAAQIESSCCSFCSRTQYERFTASSSSSLLWEMLLCRKGSVPFEEKRGSRAHQEGSALLEKDLHYSKIRSVGLSR